MIISAISYQANSKKRLLIIQTGAVICMCSSYLFLGAYAGFAMNAIALIRNLCFYFIKEKTKAYYISTALLIAAMGIAGATAWQGPISLLVIVALMLNTFFMSLGKPQILRYSLLVTCVMVLIYNINVFTIGGILNEIVSFASAAVGIVIYLVKKRAKKNKATE
jgi:hypothetical protein